MERKAAPRTRNLSLKQALGLISTSPAGTIPKTPRAKSVTRNATHDPSRLNDSHRSCATKLLCLQLQTEQVSETDTAGVCGALGLTLVTEMFKAQSISTQGMKESEQSVKSKKGRKITLRRTPSRLGIKRKSAVEKGADKNILVVDTSTHMSSSSETSAQGSSSSNTTLFGNGPSSAVGVEIAAKSPTHKPPLRKVFSALHKEPLSREWSTGTLNLKELDMSLETSIMNSLYPQNDSSLSLTDSMVSTDSVSIVPPGIEKTPKRPSGSSTNSPRRSLRNIINTVGSPLQNDIKGTLSLTTPNKQPGQNCESPSSILDNSYTRAQADAFIIGTPTQEKVSSGRENQRREISKRASTRSLPAKSTITRSTGKMKGRPDPSDPSAWHPTRPVGRSRSLRLWGAGGGVEVTGWAGNTPKPRRRRHPSYEERLI